MRHLSLFSSAGRCRSAFFGFVAALSLALALPSPAAQLVIWSFPSLPANSGDPVSPTAETVVGSPTLVRRNQSIAAGGTAGVAYTDSISVNHPANLAIHWNDFRGGGDDGEVRMTLNTTGFIDLALRFDVRESHKNNSSVRRLLVDYSTDGGTNFVPITTLTVIDNNTFSAKTVDLSFIGAIDNAASVILRLSQGGENDGEALNNFVSFDNLEITGTVTGPGSPTLTVSGATTPRLKLPATGGGAAAA